MLYKLMSISFLLTFLFGCNIFGESEIDAGFVLGPSSEGRVFWIDASTDVDITYATGNEIDFIGDKNYNGTNIDCSAANYPLYMENQQNGLGGMVTVSAPTCTVSNYSLADIGSGARFTFFVVSKVTEDVIGMVLFDKFALDTLTPEVGITGNMYPAGDLKDPVVITYELINMNTVSVYRNTSLIVNEQTATTTMIVSGGTAMVNMSNGSTIFEMILYERSLSTDERLGIQSYLIAKWGL